MRQSETLNDFEAAVLAAWHSPPKKPFSPPTWCESFDPEPADLPACLGLN